MDYMTHASCNNIWCTTAQLVALSRVGVCKVWCACTLQVVSQDRVVLVVDVLCVAFVTVSPLLCCLRYCVAFIIGVVFASVSPSKQSLLLSSTCVTFVRLELGVNCTWFQNAQGAL